MRKWLRGGVFTLLAATVPAQEHQMLVSAWDEAGAYDIARQQFVVTGFGGMTQEWNGLSWNVRPHELLPIESVQVCYDSSQRRLLIVGTQSGVADLVTYRSRGTSWERLSPASAPPARRSFAMAYDEARNELLLFGGFSSFGHADTWTFQGGSWAQRNPAVAPPPMWGGHSMTYDVARQRVLLFGVNAGSPVRNDLWEWDGTNWFQPALGLQPPARSAASFSHDPMRGRTVLFGGLGAIGTLLGDLWEYDGVQWTPMAQGPAAPAARSNAITTFDANRGETLLAGGFDNVDFLTDSWSWNGTRWLLHPGLPKRPPLRSDPMILANPAASGFVLFGGADATHALGDAWLWNGNSWLPQQGTRPSARRWAATCSGLPFSYLFGGIDDLQPGPPQSDFWRWDGLNWQQVAAPNGPSPRIGAAMAFDYAAGQVVLFGGLDLTAFQDTWTFDGISWTPHQLQSSPPPRAFAAMAPDLARSRVVMFGGRPPMNGAMSNDTWLWDGSAWSQAATVGPAGLYTATMDYDPQLQQIVMVSAGGYQRPTQAWSFDGQTWNPLGLPPNTRFFESTRVTGGLLVPSLSIVDLSSVSTFAVAAARTHPYGTPCGAQAPYLSASQWPRIGTGTFTLEVAEAPNGSFVALLGATNSASLSVGPCTLLVAPGQSSQLLSTSANGLALQALPIPNSSAWIGVSLFFQVAALLPQSPTGFALSNGLQITLGT